MWELLIDYDKHEWQHVLKQIQKNPNNENKILEALDRVWGLHHAICLRDGRKVRWCYQQPLNDIICIKFT
jgi:ABC-type Fe2+-enterobactin transport system substrate-binding protein